MTTEQAIQKTREVMRLRHLSHATEQSYCGWLVRFARFVSEQCEAHLKPEQKMEAFLTQLANVKALQEALGHSQVQTTIGYCHVEACGVPSPLEALVP